MNVLLMHIDDEVHDRVLFARAVRRVAKQYGYQVTLQQQTHGAAARDHLMQAEILPDLIVLDISMPLENGLQFLRTIRASPRSDLRRLPVYVLTTSSSRMDIEAARGLASVYLVKTADRKAYTEMVSAALAVARFDAFVGL